MHQLLALSRYVFGFTQMQQTKSDITMMSMQSLAIDPLKLQTNKTLLFELHNT